MPPLDNPVTVTVINVNNNCDLDTFFLSEDFF